MSKPIIGVVVQFHSRAARSNDPDKRTPLAALIVDIKAQNHSADVLVDLLVFDRLGRPATETGVCFRGSQAEGIAQNLYRFCYPIPFPEPEPGQAAAVGT
jgi:hypothetical protein